jgi:hypothetical protein
MLVPCPHCQKRTRLTLPGSASAVASVPPPPNPPAIPTAPGPSHAPRDVSPAAAATPSAPSVPIGEPAAGPKSKGGLLIGIGVALIVLAAGGYLGYKKFLSVPETQADSPTPRTAKSKKPSVTNAEPAGAETAAAPASAKKPKSPQDLKTGAVTLEKSKGGSSLVYGVGDIRNDSEYQRFGVKVELNVFDAAGKNAGKATDYIQVIEPHGSWRFHALILDPKATSAKIAGVSEAE